MSRVYINFSHPQKFCFSLQFFFSSHQVFIYVFLIFCTSDLFISLLAIISSFSSIGFFIKSFHHKFINLAFYFINWLHSHQLAYKSLFFIIWLKKSLFFINWLKNHCFSSSGLKIIIFFSLTGLYIITFIYWLKNHNFINRLLFSFCLSSWLSIFIYFRLSTISTIFCSSISLSGFSFCKLSIFLLPIITTIADPPITHFIIITIHQLHCLLIIILYSITHISNNIYICINHYYYHTITFTKPISLLDSITNHIKYNYIFLVNK